MALTSRRPAHAAGSAAESPRSRRLREPLLIAVWGLLAVEAAGGLIIFVARLLGHGEPGAALHVGAGAALTAIYAGYQWSHWRRVRPFRSRLDYALGLIAGCAMTLVNGSGLGLGWLWWKGHGNTGHPVAYPPLWSALHNIASMLVLTFVGAHLGAVLMRDRGHEEKGTLKVT